MHKPTDFRLPDDDDRRADIGQLLLEIINVAHTHFAEHSDPLHTLCVATTMAHGCSIGQPFGVSKLATLTHLSRQKVYTILDELIDRELVIRTHVEGTRHPVYVRNTKHPHQQDKIPDLYDKIQQACHRYCPL
jgi:hypothetical protein